MMSDDLEAAVITDAERELMVAIGLAILDQVEDEPDHETITDERGYCLICYPDGGPEDADDARA